MAITYGEIHRRVVEDDASGPYTYGIQAKTTIHIPYGETWITQDIISPGLWGVENPDEEYVAEIFGDEVEVLLAMLSELGATPRKERVA